MKTISSHNCMTERNAELPSRHPLHPFYSSRDKQVVNLPLPEDVPTEKLFRVELYRTEERGGKFTPAARLIVRKAFRTSGFLRSLPDAEARTLLLLLTFLRPDGRCEVSALEAAKALETSPAKAQARLDRLATIQFADQPIVHVLRRDSSLDGYVLSTALVEEQQLTSAAEESVAEAAQSAQSAQRADVIAHSRSLYANPRAEVEAMILTQQLGKAPSVPTAPQTIYPSTPEGAARHAMLQIGLPSDQIDLLIASFPIDKIAEQIAWLPHRHPKDPAKLLVSAIRHDYEPPAYVRLQQAVQSDEPTGEGVGTTTNPEQAEEGKSK